MRAFWKTLLVYAIAGPLVGLLVLLLISVLAAEWQSIAHAASVLISRAQQAPCVPPHDGIFDLRCYQQEEPIRLWYPEFSAPNPQRLSVVVMAAYVIGIVPALLAGFLVCTIRLSDNKFGFRQATLVGTLIGFATGALALRNPLAALLLFFLCLFATVVCWRLTDRWWQRGRQQVAPSGG